MAIKFFDGCGLYKSVADANAVPNGLRIYGNGAYSLNLGRFGGGCIQSVNGGAFWCPMAAAQGAVQFFGMSFRMNTLSSSGQVLLRFVDVNNNVIGAVQLDGLGRLQIVNQVPAVLQTSAVAIGLNIWNRLEVKFVAGTTATNGQMVVRFNGQEILNQQGILTRNGTGTMLRVDVYGPGIQSDGCRYDDIVVWDDTGSANKDFLGDIRIDELLPTANGAEQAWTPNTGAAWDAVNDALTASDDDTTFISSGTVGAKSKFTMSDLPSSSDKIFAVQPRARVKKSDAGTRTIKTYIHSGSVDSEDAVAFDPTTAYNTAIGNIRETDPNTAAAWTDAGVNALEVGVEVVT